MLIYFIAKYYLVIQYFSMLLSNYHGLVLMRKIAIPLSGNCSFLIIKSHNVSDRKVCTLRQFYI